jgi:hypothetical protein
MQMGRRGVVWDRERQVEMELGKVIKMEMGKEYGKEEKGKGRRNEMTWPTQTKFLDPPLLRTVLSELHYQETTQLPDTAVAVRDHRLVKYFLQSRCNNTHPG